MNNERRKIIRLKRHFAEELDGWLETLEILAIPGIRESIAEGMKDVKQGKCAPLSELSMDEAA